jgi:hypothetical protein
MRNDNLPPQLRDILNAFSPSVPDETVSHIRRMREAIDMPTEAELNREEYAREDAESRGEEP